MHQKATNVGLTEQEFMWGHHPAFGFPFLDGSVQLHLPGQPTVFIDPPAHYICPFDRKTEGPWPLLPDKDGKMVDMSRAREYGTELYMEYGVKDLQEGKYELVNHNTGLGVRMTWDKDVFRYLWIWALYGACQDYPWYGRAYILAVEPWSSMPGDYRLAKESGTLLTLKAGQSMEVSLNTQLFETEECQ